LNERQFKLGMGQMLVRGAAVDENMERALSMIADAADSGCQMVVLPECMDVGWTHPAAHELAEPIPGERTRMLAEAARKSGIYVVAGLTERDGGRIYNAAVLISPEGALMLKHRKINVLTIAQDLYSVGDSLAVAETSLGTVAVNICADNFKSSLALGHSLARMGARILLSPCAWAVDADHDNEKNPYGQGWRDSYCTLARLYEMPVVGVSNVGWIEGGPWKDRKCIGCSLAVGAGGDVLAQGPYGESAEKLMVVDIQVRDIGITGTAFAEYLKEKGYEGP